MTELSLKVLFLTVIFKCYHMFKVSSTRPLEAEARASAVDLVKVSHKLVTHFRRVRGQSCIRHREGAGLTPD